MAADFGRSGLRQDRSHQDKKYKLTKQHGPWMIIVTTLKGSTTEEHQRAEAAAHELVYELRLKEIPAYTFKQGKKIDHVEAVNRQGLSSRKIVAQQRPEIAVLAGNFNDTIPESDAYKISKKTLEFIKLFRPHVLKKHAELLDMAADQMDDQAGPKKLPWRVDGCRSREPTGTLPADDSKGRTG